MDASIKRFSQSIRSQPKPHVLIMIGVPGSGKSHVARQLSSLTGYPIISSDAIREEVAGEERDQTRDREVWSLLYKRAGKAIENGTSLIIDATHNVSRQRREDIGYYRSHGARTIYGIYVSTPLSISSARNKQRNRMVPEHIVSKMHRRLSDTPPSRDEGFDELFVLDSSDKT